jgi:cytochrome c oxidase subunit 4
MSPQLRERLRAPFLTFLALQFLLGVNVLLGIFFLGNRTWIIEVFIAAGMVAIVILFAMEALKDPPLTRLFSAMGFMWVAVLFSLTLLDYVTR